MDPNATSPAVPAAGPNAPVQTPVMPGTDQPAGAPMGTPAPVEPTMPEPTAPVEPTQVVPEQGTGDAGTGMPPAVPPAV